MWKNTPFFSSNTAIRHGTGVLQEGKKKADELGNSFHET
jgi:hypothetical protein